MAGDILYCKLPTSIVSLTANLSNIAMIILIQVTNKLNGPMKTWITNLGIINALFSLTISARSVMSTFAVSQSHLTQTTEIIVMSFGTFMTIVQLASQAAIALERLLVVRFPIEYRSRYSKTDRKIPAFLIWVGSAVLGIFIGGSSIQFHIPLLFSTCTWVFFTGIFVVQVWSYVFVLREIKASSRQIKQMMAPANQRVPVIEAKRRKQERQLHILAAGITLSYICCNFPFMVFVGFYEVKMESQTCYTKEGLFYTLSLGFVCLNLLIDPLWYFFLSFFNK